MSSRFRWFTLTRALAAACASVATAATLVAQGATGSVKGKITDAANGQPIRSAQVFVVGTRVGANVVDHIVAAREEKGRFVDFNDFMADCDRVLTDLELDGVLQVADFHPRYQFAGTQPDDISNFTNRAPYPTLHLLREDSVDKAVAAFPDASLIYERNMEVLEALGREGWEALGVGGHI